MNTPNASRILEFVITELSSITSRPTTDFTGETPLIGEGSSVKSRELVELLISIEDYVEEKFGMEFDWASDSLMSRDSSILRNVDSLVGHMARLIAAD